MKDYYKILGVEKNAPKEEIKKAFHKLAHKYHPDKKDGDEAKFKEASEAYQTLSDDTKRRQYDTFGSGTSSGAGTGPGGWNFDFSNFQNAGANSGQGFEFDLGNIFGDFFGGAQGRTNRGRDISVDIEISFSESIFGVERKILIHKLNLCSTCSGSGAEPGSKMKTCSVCKGQGKVQETQRSVFGNFTSVRPCKDCQGRGQIAETACKTCKGQGAVSGNEEIKVIVPAGIENAEMLRLSGRGEAMPGGVAGDLYIKVHVSKHPLWRREDYNLISDLKLKLSEAVLGADKKIETLDGEITLKVPVGSNQGDILRVRGKGVPMRSGKRGDLLIRLQVAMPNPLSRQVKKIIEDLRNEGF
ncbi:hypothetical protein BK005_01445 [bacterium CG10_37_50]|nr:MAG: hypothetical protein BK005_01445 [bacterium CG10_37_50]